MSAYFTILTAKQKKVYLAIESYIKNRGIPPTVREIGELVGEKTPGAIQGILNRLEQKGAIKRQSGMARSIQLVSTDGVMYSDPVYIPEIKKISARTIENILSFYNIIKYHPVSPDFADDKEGRFIVKCPEMMPDDMLFSKEDMLLVNMHSEISEGDVVLGFFSGRACLNRYLKNTEMSVLGKVELKFARIIPEG